MSIQKYEALTRAVDLGSLTRAAEELGYTQSGLSHIINSLEQEWGVRLLLRSRSGVQLTAEGEQLLPVIRRICRENHGLLQTIASLHGLETGTIRIGCISSVSMHILPMLIKSFHDRYPNIRFDLHHGSYNEMERWIAEDVVECAITFLSGRLPCDSLPLFEDQLVVVLPEDCEHEGAVFEVADIPRYPFVYHHERGGEEVSLQERFRAMGIQPDRHFTAEDDITLMSMVECGLGISVLSELFLYRNPFRVRVKELHPAVHRRIGITFKRRDRFSLATERFVQHVQRELPGLWQGKVYAAQDLGAAPQDPPAFS